MPGKLLLHKRFDQGGQLASLTAGSYSLGREPENSIQVEAASVSRRHGELFTSGAQWFFRDLGSSNGSWLNGEKVREGAIRILRSNDTLKLAEAEFTVFIEDQSAAEGIVIYVFENGSFHSEQPLYTPQALFTLGGEAGVVPIPDREQLLSIGLLGPRAILQVSEAGVENNIVVNSSKVKGERTLSDGDVIEVGPYVVLISDRLTSRAVKPAPVGGMVGDDLASDSAGTSSRGNLSYDDWQSEAAKRKSDGKKFVFGAEHAEVTEGNGLQRNSFEMNISQRVPTVNTREIDPQTKRFHLALYIGVFVLALLLVALLGFIIQVVS